MMLAIVLAIPLAAASQPVDDVLDQNSPLGYQGYICGINNNYLAQSFKPKLSSLSRVELGLFKQENITGNFTVSIRERLNGDNLTSTTFPIESVPWQYYGDWVSIDLPDINVTRNKRYYIVFTSDDTRSVLWIISSYNPYWRGRPWMFGGSIPFWIPAFLTITKIPDMSFRTYGYPDVWG